ncbi:MAG: phosphotransferase family protein [Solirubrobacterales bacterium]
MAGEIGEADGKMMMTTTEREATADVGRRLAAWAEVSAGGGSVDAVAPLSGNSGVNYAFTLNRDGMAEERLVLRLSPADVRRRGNTDVLRQVPLLDALAHAGLPVAAIRWSEADSAIFGTDAYIQEFIDGRPLHMFDAALSIEGGPAEIEKMVRQGIDAMVAIHAFDWRARLADWSPPRDIAAELDFWERLVDRMAEPDWISEARAFADQLRATAPAAAPIGLVHGDLQMNNVLFSPRHDLLAVIDWEIAGIGPQPLDLGWLAFMTDSTCWHHDYLRDLRVRFEPDTLLEMYERAGGRPIERFAWWQALACFRFAVIAGFNLRLHRTGKRTDPLYETLVTSVPVMLARGRELAEAGR